MSTHTYALTTARIAKFKGQILAHAIPREVLSKGGRQVSFPKNNSDTYVARRFLPYGATSTSASTQNTFFGTTTAVDRSAAVVQANQVQEGITPTPDSIVPVDVTVVMQQYGCLYGYTDKTGNLYEDDIPAEMIKQYGERMALVNEQIVYGALKACTNQFYGGTGTTRATVNGKITLNLLRRIAKSLLANHASTVTRVLAASPKFDTSAVQAGFIVYHSTDMNSDIRDLPNFTPAEKYASGSPMENELGKCEEFRFVMSPDLPSILDAATSVTASTYGLQSAAGTNPDVYQFVVTGADAWSQIAVRGLDNNMSPTHIPPGQKDKSDPMGQRGYVGGTWWKAVMVENDGWMAIGNVGVTNLSA